MVKMVSAVLVLWVLHLAVASGTCASYSGPSPYEYDIDKQMTYRESMRNLVAGWRQYGDKLLYK
jgi:hypothetical protein